MGQDHNFVILDELDWKNREEGGIAQGGSSDKLARGNGSPGRLRIPPPYHSAEMPTFRLPSSQTAHNVTH